MDARLKCPDTLDDDFKAYLQQTILTWMVGDAKTAAANKAFVGALILGVCALDVLGGLYSGTKTSGDTFRAFITDFVPTHPAYLQDMVYENMRSTLVHGYSTDGFQYTDEHRERHLTRDENGLWVHVDSFLNEVEEAAKAYMDDLFQKEELWNRFKKKWQLDPLLQPIPD